MEEIIWEYIEEKINNLDIQKIEQYFNIKLPKAYINCIKENNGGSPIPCIFNIGKEDGYVFNNLININKIVTVYENLSKYLGNLIPFADDPAGNLLCFDYRDKKTQKPKIVFWNHELAAHPEYQDKAIKEICDSFSTLLQILHDDIDED